jgi:hypothetical protein
MIVLRKIAGKLQPILQSTRERFAIGNAGDASLMALLPGMSVMLAVILFVGFLFLSTHGVHSAMSVPMSMMGVGAIAIPSANSRQQLLPFRMGTRRRIQPLGAFPFVPGTPIPTITIPQVGMLSKIYLKIEGTITQTGAAAVLSPLGYAALISRIRVNANLGSASIVDATAAGVELANFWYAPSTGRVQNTYPNGAGANAVSYGLVIPINANDRSLLEIGLINLQAEQVRVTLDVTPCPSGLSFLLSGGPVTATALTMYVYYEYWDVPNPSRYLLPPASISRILEESQPITAAGELSYVVPRLGTLTQLSEYFIAGATLATQVMATLIAPTPLVNLFRIRANKTDEWMRYDARVAEIEEELFYNSPQGTVASPAGSFMRPGVRSWDFFHSGLQSRNFGDRDLIDTEKITTLEFLATIDPTYTPSVATTRNIVRRVFQRLV